MEETVQRMSGIGRPSVNVFGVRHLSPASAHHLLAYLNELRPKCVLIEGPSDFSDLLPQIAKKQVKLPIAMLSYTAQSPICTVLYPLSEYSPEYQAIVWAFSNKAEVRFIDLPTSATICSDMRRHENESRDETDKTGEIGEIDKYYLANEKFYADTVSLANEPDYETFWERHFEHSSNSDDFIEKISTFSHTMRENLEDLQWETQKKEAAYNHVREAYMKRQIAQAADKYKPAEIAAVTGAYHAKALLDDSLSPMSDEEFGALPATEVKITLMPYSYYRLSSRSGYGAGNKAPAYFQLMWECLKCGDMERLAPLYLSNIGFHAREAGNYNSTASIIEAVRLAKSLSAMHGGIYPTLKDLRDSAVCLLGNGELSAVSDAVARVDVGTAIGELPEGVSQTPVQDDMNRQLKRLKLEKYKSVVAQDIALDLRENRLVQNAEAAGIDLNRSIFFNRLLLLNIGFAEFRGEGSSSWSENWMLRWSPENEIEVVEATLKGETIENAAAFVLKEQFEAANSILEIAKLLRVAYICHLLSETPNGLSRLQALCVESENFAEAANTAFEISNIIKYRDVRSIDATPLIPILQQVFLRAVLVMFEGANCDEEASKGYIEAIDAMHMVSQEQFEHIDDALWLKKLRELADSDSRNAKISGVATAILMERGEISDEDLKTSVMRRMSYGVPGDLAALWFEGLSARNRYVLLSKVSIWKQLDDYLDTLDDAGFRRALVFLRRAFSAFEPNEKNSITDILADLWNIDVTEIGGFLQGELTEGEQDSFDELNDFDFDL